MNTNTIVPAVGTAIIATTLNYYKKKGIHFIGGKIAHIYEYPDVSPDVDLIDVKLYNENMHEIQGDHSHIVLVSNIILEIH